jgi:hypothetical protein
METRQSSFPRPRSLRSGESKAITLSERRRIPDSIARRLERATDLAQQTNDGLSIGSDHSFLSRPEEPTVRRVGFPSRRLTFSGGIRWLETSTIKQLNIMKMLPSPTAPLRSIMARGIMQKPKSTQAALNNTLKTPANIASRLTPRASSKSKAKGGLA